MSTHNRGEEIKFETATPYQVIYLFMKSSLDIYQLMENIANNKDCEIFKRIDKRPIISLDDYYHVYQLIKNGYIRLDSKIESDIKSLLNNLITTI